MAVKLIAALLTGESYTEDTRMALTAYQRDSKNVSGLVFQIKRAIQVQAFADRNTDAAAMTFFASVYAGRTKFNVVTAATIVYDLSIGTGTDLSVLKLSATDAEVSTCVTAAMPLLKALQAREDLPTVDFR